MQTFAEYLKWQGHTDASIKTYLFANRFFLRFNKNTEGFGYRDVIIYLSDLRKRYTNSKVLAQLYSLKKYYSYLISIGKRDNHPCITLTLRINFKKPIIHHDLFTNEELELLLSREERYKILMLKNQLIISFLIYQGLRSNEIRSLNISSIDLLTNTLNIRKSRTANARKLKLTKRQIDILNSYLFDVRDKLLKNKQDALVIGKTGHRITVDDIHYLISTFRSYFPDRKLTPESIRQSVISNWLNTYKIPLEQVQLMAGHKWISSTLRYRQQDIHQQKALLDRWFPLK